MPNATVDTSTQLIGTSQSVIIDAGTLMFSEEDMAASGLLVPYGVQARTNIGGMTVEAGTFSIPEDSLGSVLNVEHVRENAVGGVTKYWEQPEGLFASFKFANTAAGRAAFADAKSGKRKSLSVEAAGVRIKDGKAISGAVFGAALVAAPAFPGATLLAAAEDTPVIDEQEDTSPEHLAIEAEVLPEDVTVTTPDGEAVYKPQPTPAEETQEEGPLMATEVIEAGATVPATLLAGQTTPAPKKEEEVDLGTVFASMNAVKNGNSQDAETLLAALSDIKFASSGGLVTPASGIMQPAWVGKLWQGRRYERKYIDLVNHFYGGIQLGGRKGFILDQGTALVAEVANAAQKVELPTGTASTSTKGSTLRKFGYAADIAREWFDLEGGADVLQAFWEGVVESYAKITDDRALKDIFSTAAGASLANLRDPGTYPSVAGHDYPEAMGILIDAIEAVEDANDSPSFAVVNPTAWRQLLFTPKDLVPEFVNFAVNVGEGKGQVAGKVNVVKAPASYFVDLDPAEPAVIAGAKSAIEFRENGSTPIQIDALEVAKYGVDRAIVGFLETFVVRPESLVLFGTEDA
jgi:hypothetical protein